MKVTLKHLYKDRGNDWNCQVDEYTKVKYFETYRDDQKILWLEIYFDDPSKNHIYVDITDYDNIKNYIECSIRD